MSWVDGDSSHPHETAIAFPMVCFCDIPLSRIDEHVNFYGEYGLGLSRDWGLKNNLTPVIYTTAHNPISRALLTINTILTKTDQQTQNELNIAIDQLVRRIKPLEGTMFVHGQAVRKDFYQELEWRHLPELSELKRSIWMQDTIEIEAGNQATRNNAMLRFTPQDVRFLFVATDADIPPLVNFIQSELDTFPSADLKILISRITSLEALRRDW